MLTHVPCSGLGDEARWHMSQLCLHSPFRGSSCGSWPPCALICEYRESGARRRQITVALLPWFPKFRLSAPRMFVVRVGVNYGEITGSTAGFYLFIIFLFNLFFFRAVPVAYGGFQARGQIGATAAGLHHSSQQHWILQRLSEATDQT